LRWKT